MTRSDVVGAHKTTIYSSGGYTHVRYRNTCVVSFSPEYIILRTGGWYTATTKNRMNQAAEQFGLSYHVSQTDHTWHIAVGGCKRQSKQYRISNPDWQDMVYTFHEDGFDDILTIRRKDFTIVDQDQCAYGIPAISADQGE